MTGKIDLKLFPFRGGPAVIGENGFCAPRAYLERCWRCGAQTGCDDRKEVAAEAWNRGAR